MVEGDSADVVCGNEGGDMSRGRQPTRMRMKGTVAEAERYGAVSHGKSLRPQPDDGLMKVITTMVPMSELDAMIAMGWGSTPRSEIPADWRHKHGPYYDRPDEG